MKIPFAALRSNVQKLPRLPIPALDDTFRRYADSLGPLTKKKEKLSAHLATMTAFHESTAPKVQAALIERDAAAAASGVYPFTYIEQQWDDGYLAWRGPLPVNIAPAIALKRLQAVSGQCDTAAAYLASIVKFIRKMTTDGVDAVDPPSDLSFFANQFCTSRVPLPERDAISTTGDMTKPLHAVVLCQQKMYTVALTDADGNALSRPAIAAALAYILKMRDSDAHFAVNCLTATGRNDWAASRADLVREDPANADVLRKIDDAVIVVCLDTEAWSRDQSQKLAAVLHGGAEPHNRWYDKHQLIVDADGSAAFNFEHSFSDGMIWLRWLSEVIGDIEGSPVKGTSYTPLPTLPQSAETTAPVAPLCLVFGKSFGSRLRSSEQDLQKLTQGVALHSVVLPFGRKLLKAANLAPDAFCQAAIQGAFYRRRSKMAPTYESCSTRGFFHGRTETIRSATPEMAAFLTALCEAKVGEASTEQREQLLARFQNAAAKHLVLAKDAQAGQGVDRHLLALKGVVKELNDPAGLAFFNEDLYQYSGTWLLSTSNVSSPFIDVFNFGPVAADGFGVGYGIDTDSIVFGLSLGGVGVHAKLVEFAKSLESTARDLLHLGGHNF